MIAYLVAHLKNDVELAALVDDRIWSNIMPQGSTLPAIVFQQSGRTATHHRGGSDGISATRWQFAVNGRTYQAVRSVTDALTAALQTFDRSGSPYVARVFVENVVDDVQPGYDSTDYFRTLVNATVLATDGTGSSPRATVYAGDTIQILVTITDENGDAINLAGATAVYVLTTAPSAAALVTKDSEVLADNLNLLVGGVAEINLEPEDTEDFVQGTYYHELEVVTADDETITAMAEYINFRETV